jgi:hypothetical protein
VGAASTWRPRRQAVDPANLRQDTAALVPMSSSCHVAVSIKKKGKRSSRLV